MLKLLFAVVASLRLITAHAEEIDAAYNDDNSARWTIDTAKIKVDNGGAIFAAIYMYDESGKTPAYILIKGCVTGYGRFLFGAHVGGKPKVSELYWRAEGSRVYDKLARVTCMASEVAAWAQQRQFAGALGRF